MADDDKESVDRAFAELVAGYHLTADRPEPTEPPAAAGAGPDGPEPAPPPVTRPGTPAPGSVFETPWPSPQEEPPPEETEEEHFDPGPPPPLPRPSWPVLLGWIGIGYAALTVLAVTVGVTLPRWAVWAGLLGFLGGFGLLVSRLPRQRPPDAGDGAVL